MTMTLDTFRPLAVKGTCLLGVGAMTKRRKNLITLLLSGLLVTMALGMITGFIAGYMSDVTDDRMGMLLFWVIGAFAVITMVICMIFSFKWMQSIDEAAREAHKAAWFWGGTGGMSLGMVLVILSSLPQAERLPLSTWLDGRTDPAAFMATGALAMLLLMTLGYTIVWAWWWWKRR